MVNIRRWDMEQEVFILGCLKERIVVTISVVPFHLLRHCVQIEQHVLPSVLI